MAEAINDSLPRLVGRAYVQLIVNDSPILIQLDGDNAPVTAGNFAQLVSRDFYNGISFHRVVTEPQPFVAQAGDPQSKDPNFPPANLGSGNYIDPDTGKPRFIPLEIKPQGEEDPIYGETLEQAGITAPPLLQHRQGAIAMARSEAPDSASSQFYITLADTPFLDGNYAVFGYVRQNFASVQKIKQGDRIQLAQVTQGANNLVTGTAKTFTVNTLRDEDNGIDKGRVSLRDAINAANANPGKDIIVFSQSLSGGSINLTTGKNLDINDSVIIRGLGANQITVNGRGKNLTAFNINDGNDDNDIEVSISDLTITRARKGGIINSENLELNNNTIFNNSAQSGAGIFNSGNLAISNSSIVSNKSKNNGGGILNQGNLTITNATISGNTASSGGGIDNKDEGDLTIKNSTITSNRARRNQGGGILTEKAASIGNTIVAGNSRSDVDFTGDNNTFESAGGNVIGTGKGVSKFTQERDKQNIKDPLLLPLANNGGSTPTHGLRFNSAAVDNGIDKEVSIPQDQTGFRRLEGQRVDSGAYELLIASGKTGTSDSEAVVGTDQTDNLQGLAGEDTLYGLKANDRLVGGGGDDLLIGGLGRDVLIGNAGFDVYLFDSPKEGTDIIRDFSITDDNIVMSAKGFGGDLKTGTLPDQQFALAGKQSGADYRFIYNQGNGRLFFDSDGNGANSQREIARLTGSPELVASSIIIF